MLLFFYNPEIFALFRPIDAILLSLFHFIKRRNER